ncbi:nucleoid-associated protein [Sediminibacterium soli]|uniref:nucleoid-associated protein n=1 Tax=Sediminibacterium soli TaxID=2698829 RepID=UPI00137AF081|nr:nucleoid-associated protein [Sediminibacterium soli]NCI48235.1 nucleoid-associated protein [Sediminibacterium soli]
MSDHSRAALQQLAVHYTGNKTNGESLVLSNEAIELPDVTSRELLLGFCLDSFKSAPYCSFTSTTGDRELNPLFQFAKAIFGNRDSFFENSRKIATHLYEVSVHPQIKPGDLFITYLSSLEIDGIVTDAIGIYKSENRQPFLKVAAASGRFELKFDDGISLEKVDKGCLIFNTDEQKGYKIMSIDKVSKTGSAQYWNDLFLMLKPADTGFNHTSEIMSITRDFITKAYPKEFEVSRTDQIDLLNRSVSYFRTHDTYEKKSFEEEVLHHPEMIESFRNFNDQHSVKNEMDIADNFSISSQAVNKQARIFKSVLKLDRNFHIYIHGDRNLIEKGEDSGGRKYYKIYYEEES